VDVEAVSSGGTTQTTSTFRVSSLPSGLPVTLSSQDGWLETNLQSGLLARETLAVTIGAGGAPIPTAEPLPVFPHRGPDVQPGRRLYRWARRSSPIGASRSKCSSAATRTPSRCSASTSRLGHGFPLRRVPTRVPVLTLATSEPGTYGVFAEASSDVAAPGAVSDLALPPDRPTTLCN